jgi:succinate dehydrogenase/fumarate reductase flavoprotein subunit
MKFGDVNKVFCDVLVIGGGGAGLRAAIEAREMGADVILVSKSRVGHATNTWIAKAFIAATGWGDAQDDQHVHLKDTVMGGRFLNDQGLVSAMVQGAEAQISFLEKCGVPFAKKEGRFDLVFMSGHSYARHVRGQNTTGSDLVVPLKEYSKKIGVRFADRVFVSRLFSSGNRIAAASGITEDGRFQVFAAKCVVLTTGGFAHAYLHTNNAAGITGDGQALAFELGVPLKDMEFVQYYPTALGRLGNRVLLYEAFLANSGAILKNAGGEDIFARHGLGDPLLITRDQLAQTIMLEILEGRDVDGRVIMDLGPVSDENIARYRVLLPQGWTDDQRELLVSPTAHFCMGGVSIDKNTETSLPGLFAVGEVSAGIHGANRLAGNALCEVFAMGHVAGRRAAAQARELGPPEMPEKEVAEEKARLEALFHKEGPKPKDVCATLKEVMWYKAGILRHQEGLEEALKQVQELKTLGANASITKTGDLIRSLELQNLLLLSEMVCRTALLRTESRGSHYRSDYPEEDNTNWLKNIVVRKEDTGMKVEVVPVSPGPVTCG